MSKARVIHYINQFFAGKGGEEKADLTVQVIEGSVGPGKRLQVLLGGAAEIVATVYCGDNYFNEHTDEALSSIRQITQDWNVGLVVAGPAFASGRYGVACAEVCHFLSASLEIDCVTGFHPENPATEILRQYRNRRVFAFPTAEVVVGMESALSKMAKYLLKLAAGEVIGPPSEEGYMDQGFRRDFFVNKNGAERAVAMLLDKLAGRPFITEIPVESIEEIPAPRRILDPSDICLTLATTSGVVPRGNPEMFRGYQNTRWAKFPIGKLNSMQDAQWEVIHGGINTEFIRGNANYGVPLDVCRDLERKGVFGRLNPFFYATSGARGLVSVMNGIGREIALDMKAEGVNAVLMVST
ncbi:MAG: glycine/betaine/sarcosine/D-proline family reductase selenoprotein B [Deltaproteobacteria bacterium]|nr:glycine/betaine/sarcosine/D-proline family reductase selenoprotein B [Deltaproteobacteria bacterium]